MKNKKMVICIVTGILIMIFIVFMLIRNRMTEMSDYQEHSYQVAPVSNTVTYWQYVFYDESVLERDSFAVRRVLSQTKNGDFIVEVCYGDMWNPPGIYFYQARQLRRSQENIMILDSNFTSIRPFFSNPPEWENYYFLASCQDSYVYILAHTHNDIANMQECQVVLFVYNLDGELVERHQWENAPDTPIKNVYVHNNYFIIIGYWSQMIYTKQGNLIYASAMPWETAGGSILTVGTVGGGHFYGLFDIDGTMVLRKTTIPSGQVIWEQELERYYNNEIIFWINGMSFCESTHRLYLYQFNALFVFDEHYNELQRVKDLTFSGSNIRAGRGFLIDYENLGDVRFSVISDNLMHLALRWVDQGQGQIITNEWIFERLTDLSAQERINEIAEIEADMPVLRMLSYGPATFNLLEIYAFDRGARVEIDFTQGESYPLSIGQAYIEVLNAAILAGTANWDIVNISYCNGSWQHYIDRGLFVNFSNYVGDRFADNDVYFARLFELLKTDGNLYYLPYTFDVPVVLVPLDFPELDYLREISRNWTWEDFYEIVQDLVVSTGVPPITNTNTVLWYNILSEFWSSSPSNVLPFYLFNETILRETGITGDNGALRKTLEFYYNLSSPALSQPVGEMGIFSFGMFSELVTAAIADFSIIDFRETYAVLPIPTMFGERHFVLGHAANAVLATGESTELAVEFLLETYGYTLQCNNIFTFIRPSEDLIERDASLRLFNDYEKVVEKTNTILRLPLSVTNPITETVDSLLHGALTLEAAVDRIADIMWLYMNE